LNTIKHQSDLLIKKHITVQLALFLTNEIFWGDHYADYHQTIRRTLVQFSKLKAITKYHKKFYARSRAKSKCFVDNSMLIDVACNRFSE
jgi:hypothetical protein